MDKKNFGTVAWTAFLKTLLLVFNLLFFAIGLAFLIIGIYGLRVFKEFFSFAPSNYIYIPLISIGIFMMIVGILSLWCTPKGVSWLLNVYGLIVFVLFMAVLALSAAFVIKRDTVVVTLKNGIENGLKIYPNESESIDLLQSTAKCCGSMNYTSWFSTSWAQSKHSVPESCCINKTECVNLNMSDKDLDGIYQEGCYTKFHNLIENNYPLITGIGFACSIIILVGSLISCSLARNLRKNRYEEVE